MKRTDAEVKQQELINMKYEIISDCGSAYFTSERDAVTAIVLLGQYHDKKIDRSKVTDALDKEGRFEDFPLIIEKEDLCIPTFR